MFTNDNKAKIKERVDFVLERVALMTLIINYLHKFLRNAKRVAIGTLVLLLAKILVLWRTNLD
jgi:uncharacterized membrane protein